MQKLDSFYLDIGNINCFSLLIYYYFLLFFVYQKQKKILIGCVKKRELFKILIGAVVWVWVFDFFLFFFFFFFNLFIKYIFSTLMRIYLFSSLSCLQRLTKSYSIYDNLLCVPYFLYTSTFDINLFKFL